MQRVCATPIIKDSEILFQYIDPHMRFHVSSSVKSSTLRSSEPLPNSTTDNPVSKSKSISNSTNSNNNTNNNKDKIKEEKRKKYLKDAKMDNTFIKMTTPTIIVNNNTFTITKDRDILKKLSDACSSNKKYQVDQLVTMNYIPLNNQDINGKTILHTECETSKWTAEKIEIIRTLIHNGASLYIVDKKRFKSA